MSERSDQEDFGEAQLGEAQAENPEPDPEMLEDEPDQGGGEEELTDMPAVAPKGRSDAESAAERAAEEAGRIGGEGGGAREAEDEAERPVAEAGGGEAEGFEEAESELVEAATHGDAAGDPLADRFTPEEEDPEAHTIHGDADEVDSTAVEDETD